VARGDAALVLEPAPAALNEVASAVGVAIVGHERLAAAGAWDDNLGILGQHGCADGIAAIAEVGNQLLKAACSRFDERWRHRHVTGVAGLYEQNAQSTGGVGQSVDLAHASAARGADALAEEPLAPAAERWTLMLVESIATEPQAPLCPVNASNTANDTHCRLQR